MDVSVIGLELGVVFKVFSLELEVLLEFSYSLYDFCWDNVLVVGRKIFWEDFFEDVIVYLIEVENLDFGLEFFFVV